MSIHANTLIVIFLFHQLLLAKQKVISTKLYFSRVCNSSVFHPTKILMVNQCSAYLFAFVTETVLMPHASFIYGLILVVVCVICECLSIP